MSLIIFGNQNSRIFKNIHWLSNCEGITGFYQNISRCNYKPDFFNYKLMVPTIDDVKNYPSHSLSFSDLVDIRINELFNVSTNSNKNISILYSGGLDSTAIVIGILKNFSIADRKNVTLLCTPSSYYEFPKIFSMLVKNFNIQYCCHALEKYTKNSVLVTGMANDLHFGSNGWIQKAISIDKDLPYENYESGMKKFLEFLYPNFGTKLFNLYRPIVEESLIPIKTVNEFIFWYYYTQGFQLVRFAYLRYKNTFTSLQTFNKLFQFYDDPRFEYYSLNNIHLTISYEHHQFKKPVKDYICDFLKDDSYQKKGKFPSYGEVIEGNRFNFGVTENWEFLSFKDSLKYFKP